MPFHWSGRTTQTLSAAALSALLMASAMKHFRDPGFYRQVVPDYICRHNEPGPAAGAAGRKRPLAVMTREEWIALSGLVEAGAAVGLLIPATSRATATGVAVLLGVFLAGHVDAVRRAYGAGGSPALRRVHTVRLPLQVPLILWAWSVRNARRRRSL